jgi:site-specific DNA recombinase
MWMGGFVPLGYNVKDRKLIINDDEAERVRYIFRRYLELGSVYKLKAELDTNGITRKRRISRTEGAKRRMQIALVPHACPSYLKVRVQRALL